MAGLLIVFALAGCQVIDTAEPEPKSPLKPIKLAGNGVALEVVHARIPAKSDLNDNIWKQVDESQVPADVRSQLSWNGFRAGVLVGQLPPALEKVILPEKPAGDESESVKPKILDEITATSRVLYLRPGNETFFQTSSTYPQINLLRLDQAGQLTGAPFTDAQGFLVVKALPESGGRVKLKLTPELHHGMVKTHFASTPGLTGGIRPQPKKDKLIFDALNMEVVLARGQMLVLGSQADRPGTAGHYFFTDESSGSREQKLIICRLSESKWDELFARHTMPTTDLNSKDKK
jgi:hypothetical protein